MQIHRDQKATFMYDQETYKFSRVFERSLKASLIYFERLRIHLALVDDINELIFCKLGHAHRPKYLFLKFL